MTDNPIPNDIALLREALIAMGRMIPGVILDDRVSNAFLASLPEEMAHYSLHRTSGQHDGAAGEGLTNEQLEPLAAHLIEINEFGPAGVNKGLAEYNVGWGTRLVQAGKGQEHSGDCTKEPWTCMVCLRDEALEHARAAWQFTQSFTPKPAPTEQARAEGYVLVPRVPTREMLLAARKVAVEVEEDGDTAAYPCGLEAQRIWTAMLAAAGDDAVGGGA